ncbi:alanine dehydrogenase [Haloferula sargassicola]
MKSTPTPSSVGVPREIKPQEKRVALIPSTAAELVRDGHRVFVEKGAGAGAGYPDVMYERAGATMVDSHEGVFEQAELIVKVKEPQASEIPLLGPKHILFTYLHLAADAGLTRGLMDCGATCIAYETIEVNRRLPLLEPMSEIAGRMSALVGAYHLGTQNGGRGTLLGGVPGVLPGRVCVIGGGAAGVNAARVAMGMGADVTILEVDLERMRFLDVTMGSTHTLYSNEANLMEILPRVDLLIGAVLVPGAKAPKLITRSMLREMQPGTVVVDIAVDQGGCCETTRPTTHESPTYLEEDVLHYCVANMPAAYARTATQALTNITSKYVTELAGSGLFGAIAKIPALAGGVNVHQGKVTCPAVAEAHGLQAVHFPAA